MRRLIPALVLLATTLACRATPSPLPSSESPHATVLISLDGFRADYLARPGARRLRALAARGTRLERLLPVFPSETFPNHYSLVTGLYPAHNGIVANSMVDPTIGAKFTLSDTMVARDPRWWGGEPIWNTAERQGVRAAAMFWPGSDYAIGGRRPTWYTPFDDKYPDAARIVQVLEWLAMPAATAPRLVTLYYSNTDHAGHDYGPSAAATDTAIAHVDSLIGMLVDGLAARGLTDRVNLVIVSDHGMTEVADSRRIFLDDYLDVTLADVIGWSPMATIAPKAGRFDSVYAALRRVPHLAVYRRDSMPARFHYGNHPRITPLVALADEGWTITTRERAANRKPIRGGAHGFDPALPSMGALFVAAGPDIARGRVLPPVENIHVYPLLARLLGVTPAPNDGTLDSLRGVLRR